MQWKHDYKVTTFRIVDRNMIYMHLVQCKASFDYDELPLCFLFSPNKNPIIVCIRILFLMPFAVIELLNI